MNNKGQTLIIFIILLPLIVLILALVIDMGFLLKEKTKLYGITKTIIGNVYEKATNTNDAKTMVEELYQKNNINYENLAVLYQDNKLKIQLNSKVDSYFGKFIELKEYEIEISLTGYRENDKLIIEKG